MVTGMYRTGTATIRASIGGETGASQVTNLAACNEPVAVEGDPPVQPGGLEAFEVTFDAGTDAAARARELSQQIGFVITQNTAEGFIADLSPTQDNSVRCVFDVASVAYV